MVGPKNSPLETAMPLKLRGPPSLLGNVDIAPQVWSNCPCVHGTIGRRVGDVWLLTGMATAAAEDQGLPVSLPA